jgi:TPR repeat protein
MGGVVGVVQSSGSWPGSLLAGCALALSLAYPAFAQLNPPVSPPAASKAAAKPATAAVQAALNSPTFHKDLETFIKQQSDPARVLRYLADSGDQLSMARFCGITTDERWGFGLRPEEGIAYCRQLAEQGVPIAMYWYGRAHRTGRGTAKDDKEAVRWFLLAAEKGNSSAMSSLGWMIQNGRGTAKDNKEAVRLYRQAAEKGEPFAMVELGWMYQQGRGIAKNEAEAVRWYRQGAEKGDSWGMVNLGEMYEKGQGIAKNEAEAVRWYRKAADTGHSGGMGRLALMYEYGQGIAKNEVEAVRWYRKAADQNDAWAQNALGVMYAQGKGGLSRNIYDAINWWTKAADRGDDSGRKNLEKAGVRYPRGSRRDNLEAWGTAFIGQLLLSLLLAYVLFTAFHKKAAEGSEAESTEETPASAGRTQSDDPPVVKYPTLVAAEPYAATLVSLLVHQSKSGAATFERIMADLGETGQRLLSPTELDDKSIETALGELRQLAPLFKLQLVEACLQIALIGDQSRPALEDLIRDLCADIDSPLPLTLAPN